MEGVIDQNSLHQQEALVVAVAKQVAVYQKEAPFLIAALYKKIHQELNSGRCEPANVSATSTRQPKLTLRRFRYLQALFFIIAQGADAIAKQLPSCNVFSALLDYVTRYQWHSLALVEIEKILRAAIASPSEPLFTALSRSYFPEKLKEFARLEAVDHKFGHGFSGLLVNICKAVKESL